jgi:hypothetical protein
MVINGSYCTSVDNEVSHVFWPTTAQAVALFASTGLSLWAAGIARTRRGVPGGTAFSWMMLAVAWWSFTSAMHTLIDDYDTRIFIAKLQYLGIAPTAVLWLLFTTEYSRIAWPAQRLTRVLVWIVPVLTMVLVATNEQHRLHWTAIEEVMTPLGRRLIYRGGAWYWLHASYSYFLVLLGTITLVRGLRRFPPPYRRQTALIILGAMVPWIGNLLYLSRALPVTGLDLTPIAFTVSGACLTFGI